MASSSSTIASSPIFLSLPGNPLSSSSSRLHALFAPQSFAPSLRLARRPSLVAMAKPPSVNISEQLSDSIKEAEEVCAAEGNREACAAAWDQVEEISATIAHKRESSKGNQENDPLEKFCKDAPEADECRVYED